MRRITAKRVSAWLMALAMIVTLFPVPAFAEGDVTEVATWEELGTALSTGGSIALTADVAWTDGDAALTVPEGACPKYSEHFFKKENPVFQTIFRRNWKV